MGEENINTPLGHPTLLAFRQRGFNELMKVTIASNSIEGVLELFSLN